MIIDSSAVIGFFKKEEDFDSILTALVSNRGLLSMSTATLLECGIVMSKKVKGPGQSQLDEFIADHDVDLAPFTAAQARIAISAHTQFGKGSGHPAKLNFGDCFSYALAKETGEPLLFKGNDFAQTDIQSALD